MSRRLYSLVTILAADGGDSNDRNYNQHQHHLAVGACQSDGPQLSQTRYRFSNVSELNPDYEATKVVRFSHRSLWCCFILLIPVAIPILIYIKDSDFTRRVFLGFFAVVLIILLICFSLVIFHTRARQMVAARHNEDQHNNCAEELNPVSAQVEINTNGTPFHAPSYCHCQMTPRTSSINLVPSPNLNETSRLTIVSHQSDQQLNSELISNVTPQRENLHLQLTTFKDNPPPYHVAVNLPSPNSLETPPPPYEHASQ